MKKTILTLCAALISAAANAIYLEGTTESLEAYLGGAISSTNPTYAISYQDITSSGMTIPQATSNGSLNGVTDVTILAAPSASTTRQVAYLNIYNADNAVVTVYIQIDISGTEALLFSHTLSPGQSMEWTRETGMRVFESTIRSAFAIQSFIASGTYTKPSGLKYALVVCVGAGGGGGSGRQGAAGENRFGGSGGGGGALAFRIIGKDEIGNSTAVTVGAAGTGGAAQASTSTNGVAGTAGGDTWFGHMVLAKGGGAGSAGGTSTGGSVTGGQSSSCVPPWGPFALSGGNGSAGVTNSTSAGTGGLNGTTGAPSGAGGSGINSSNTSATGGGQGGSVYNNGVLISGPTSSASSQPNGSANQSVMILLSTSICSIYGLGTGGAGGYPGSGGSGAGGNGGNYGAGGGGGTGTLNGTTSGAGGNGGGGLIQVLEVF